MLEKIYLDFVAENNLSADPSQVELVALLEKYRAEIEEKKRGGLSSLLRLKTSSLNAGVYVWGDVGRGKSMLLNIFFGALTTPKKLHKHFHEFMIGIHKELHSQQKQNDSGLKKKDFIIKIADELAEKYHVVYLDELQINNIADAMLVGRLFKALQERGVFVFFSSNFYPDELFKDGLQRERFLPFIELLEAKFDIFNLNNYRDYRLDKLSQIASAYLFPLSHAADAELEHIIHELTGSKTLREKVINIDDNRRITAHHSYGNIAIFSFSELCEIPLGAVDYLALCQTFSTIVIKNIPKLSEDRYNEALRFITLIDCMYNTRTKLICTAEVPAEKLYEHGKCAFEFKRTISRLIEMQSAEYLGFSMDNSQGLDLSIPSAN